VRCPPSYPSPRSGQILRCLWSLKQSFGPRNPNGGHNGSRPVKADNQEVAPASVESETSGIECLENQEEEDTKLKAKNYLLLI